MSSHLILQIVIINYKTPRLVIDCLETVRPQMQEGYSVVIIDNNSGDDSVRLIRHWMESHPDMQIELIESAENGGFSAGNNLGIQLADADHYLLLNSDTLLRDGALGGLLATARQYEDVGLVSPRLEWPDGSPQISCFRYHSPVSEFINAAHTGLLTRLLSRWNVPIDVSSQVSFPQWTSFACVLVKREVIESIGFMDEGYFLYYEDVDFSRLAQNQGWKVLNDPGIRVVHLRGGSSSVKKNTAKKKRLPAYVYLSRSRYFAKHYGRAGLLLANCMWTLGRAISKLRELCGKKESSACERQAIDIWQGFLSPFRKFRPNHR